MSLSPFLSLIFNKHVCRAILDHKQISKQHTQFVFCLKSGISQLMTINNPHMIPDNLMNRLAVASLFLNFLLEVCCHDIAKFTGRPVSNWLTWRTRCTSCRKCLNYISEVATRGVLGFRGYWIRARNLKSLCLVIISSSFWRYIF